MLWSPLSQCLDHSSSYWIVYGLSEGLSTGSFSCWTLSLLASAYQLNSRCYRYQAVEYENTIQTWKDENIALVAMTISTWSKSQKKLSWRGDRCLGWEFTRIYTFCFQTAILSITHLLSHNFEGMSEYFTLDFQGAHVLLSSCSTPCRDALWSSSSVHV